MFLTAADRLSAAPEDSIAMADVSAGVRAAQAGSMAAIGIAPANDAGLVAPAHGDIDIVDRALDPASLHRQPL